MAVVINEFEAVSEPGQEKKGEGSAEGAPKKLEAAELRPPLRRLATRHARLRAH